VHEALHAKRVELGRFVTAVYARLDLGYEVATEVRPDATDAAGYARALDRHIDQLTGDSSP